MSEIFNLDLNADLVVLSACQTGLGRLVKGEGMIGLTRAFMYAGASSVVVSLWKVQDYSTAALMKSFYRHLRAGKGKAEALRQAKLNMIRSDIPAYRFPYFWAPFVLVGQAQ
jgi:CHAT domain-containing protein